MTLTHGTREAVRRESVKLLVDLWTCGGLPQDAQARSARVVGVIVQSWYLLKPPPRIDWSQVGKDAMHLITTEKDKQRKGREERLERRARECHA